MPPCAAANETYHSNKLFGGFSSVRELRQMIQTVSPTDARVLILGESGTGKDWFAGALHCLSQRRSASYVRNLHPIAAAHSENAFGKRNFGHEKGAFTGALKTKNGRSGSRRRQYFSR